MNEADEIVSELGYRPFDADNHYYEAEDAFTRHLDPAHGQRVIEWCTIGKRKYPVIAGKVSRDVTNPTFDPVSPAGAMAEYFRGNSSGKSPLEYLRPARADPPRVPRPRRPPGARWTRRASTRCGSSPRSGCSTRSTSSTTPRPSPCSSRAFNRWLLEDWGFSYQDRIFASPSISLCDVDWAIARARVGARQRRPHHRHAARAHPDRQRARCPRPTRRFDPFWARVNEAGITVVAHAGNTGF